MRRICVVTAGHLSTCPRMLNAADALSEAGYDVRVVSTRYLDWAWDADQELHSTRSWKWTVVNYQRSTASLNYFRSGVVYRCSRMAAKRLGANRCRLGVATRAYSRAHSQLVKAILKAPSDLIYGGTSGALGSVAIAAARMGISYALDLEDFHSGENGTSSEGRLNDSLARRIEGCVLKGSAFLTGGSAAIADAYERTYELKVMPRNNVFPLPKDEPDPKATAGAGLRIYWFGQTIGPGRGLETTVRAIGKAGIVAELHLRGRSAATYLEVLHHISTECAPKLRIFHHAPASPDSMVDLCHGYDVGLAVDEDRELALTNKALTYLLAGLAPVLSATLGQRSLIEDLGGEAIVIKPGDVDALANGLKRWSEDKSLLSRAKTAAWEAAKRRWHWEHDEERGALLRAVKQVFQS